MAIYWYTTCRHCDNQGRLIIMKNLTRKRLYLHCEECESGWNDPQKVADATAMFLTLLDDDKAETATWGDIEEAGWQQFAANSADT